MEGEWSASRSGRFAPETHWLGGWLGLRSRTDAVAKRKQSLPHLDRESNPGEEGKCQIPQCNAVDWCLFATTSLLCCTTKELGKAVDEITS
jgi:hypothetical protein